MKSYRFFIMSIFLLMGLSYLNGQEKFHIELPNRLPADVHLNNPHSQSYLITTDYLDYDLKGISDDISVMESRERISNFKARMDR